MRPCNSSSVSQSFQSYVLIAVVWHRPAIPSLEQKATAHQALRIPTRYPPADTPDLVEFTAKRKTEAKPVRAAMRVWRSGMQSVEMKQQRELAAWCESVSTTATLGTSQGFVKNRIAVEIGE